MLGDVPNARMDMPLPIMGRMILPDSIVYTDSFRSCDALAVWSLHHVRNSHAGRFAGQQSHSDSILEESE